MIKIRLRNIRNPRYALILTTVAITTITINSIILAAQTTYDYNSGQGTIHYIYENIDEGTFPPAWSNGWGGSEISGYTDVQLDNTVYITLEGGTPKNNDPSFRFNFTISETPANINWVYVNINGFSNYDGGEDADCYIADFVTSGGTWEKICDLPTTDGDCNHNLTASITNYIDGDQLVYLCMAKGLDSNDNLNIDHIEVTVDYTDVVSPPDITIDYPDNISFWSNPININVTTSGTADWCGYNLNGGTNTTLSGSGTNWYEEISSITDGNTYQLNVYCNDSLSAMGLNDSIWFTFDELENYQKVWDDFEDGDNISQTLWNDGRSTSQNYNVINNGSGEYWLEFNGMDASRPSLTVIEELPEDNFSIHFDFSVSDSTGADGMPRIGVYDNATDWWFIQFDYVIDDVTMIGKVGDVSGGWTTISNDLDPNTTIDDWIHGRIDVINRTYIEVYLAEGRGNITNMILQGSNTTLYPNMLARNGMYIESQYCISNWDNINVTNVTIAGGADTCTYGGSGDWEIDCSDSCATRTGVNMGGNSIILTGTGEWVISEEIENVDELIKYSTGCEIVIYPPGGKVF